jgi:regulator of replication initiation timing
MKESILDELEKVIAKLDTDEGSIEEVAEIITDCVFYFDDKIVKLCREVTECNKKIVELQEENAVLNTDKEIILEFLKKNKINISYIVKNTSK